MTAASRSIYWGTGVAVGRRHPICSKRIVRNLAVMVLMMVMVVMMMVVIMMMVGFMVRRTMMMRIARFMNFLDERLDRLVCPHCKNGVHTAG